MGLHQDTFLHRNGVISGRVGAADFKCHFVALQCCPRELMAARTSQRWNSVVLLVETSKLPDLRRVM